MPIYVRRIYKISFRWHDIREIAARKRHLLIKLLDDRTVEYTLASFYPFIIEYDS